MISTSNAKLLAAVGLGLVAVFYVLQKKSLLAGVAAGAVGVVADVGTGTVLGIGDALGVPRTNAEKCQEAQALGDFFGVVSYCPAAQGVVNAPAAAVKSVGKVFGVPLTNETECARALREGRTWDASFACPAGTFLKSLF